MKDWSELEDRYQQMMATDPTAAQTFRQRMTAKFQSNVQVNIGPNIAGSLEPVLDVFNSLATKTLCNQL